MDPKPYSTVAAYIPTDVVVKLDQEAKELQISRSNLVRRILIKYVEEKNGKEDHQFDSA